MDWPQLPSTGASIFQWICYTVVITLYGTVLGLQLFMFPFYVYFRMKNSKLDRKLAVYPFLQQLTWVIVFSQLYTICLIVYYIYFFFNPVSILKIVRKILSIIFYVITCIFASDLSFRNGKSTELARLIIFTYLTINLAEMLAALVYIRLVTKVKAQSIKYIGYQVVVSSCMKGMFFLGLFYRILCGDEPFSASATCISLEAVTYQFSLQLSYILSRKSNMEVLQTGLKKFRKRVDNRVYTIS